MPITILSHTDGAVTTCTGMQSRKLSIEALAHDDLPGSFERFQSKFSHLMDIGAVFVQAPGQFLTDQTALVDHRLDTDAAWSD